MNTDIFEMHLWKPLEKFGLSHSFFHLNAHTLIYTWIGMGIIFVVALAARLALNYPRSLACYTVKKGIGLLMGMVKQSCGKFVYRYFTFIAALFIFIFICNAIVIIPGIEEPTKDLNTTFALALLSFFYIQKNAIQKHGFFAYIQEYFSMPLTLLPATWPNQWYKQVFAIILIAFKAVGNIIAGLFSLPLELLSKFSSIISLSLRLFGNIFGGSLIGSMWSSALSGSAILQALGLISGINLVIMIFFGIFEGFIQAFVFSVLSATYLAMAVQDEDNA